VKRLAVSASVASVAALAALTLPLPALAHMPWLLPSATLVTAPDGMVSIDAVVSEDLFVFERALDVDAPHIVGPNGVQVTAQNIVRARNHVSFELTLPVEGCYRVSQSSTQWMISFMQDGKLQRKRGGVEALPAGAELKSVVQMRSRQETFVSRERAGTPDFAPEAQGLELQALSAVTDLSDGDHTRLRLLRDGLPLPDATVTLRREGNRWRYDSGEQTLHTDARGEVTIAWTQPGRYWLGASAGARQGEDGGTAAAPLLRDSISATFEVLPR